MKNLFLLPIAFFIWVGLVSFKNSSIGNVFHSIAPLEKLSDYQLFQGNLAELNPAQDVIPYQLNMPLFSDYAFKARFVKIPQGEQVKYNQKDVFEFPIGTILVKNFYYPLDFRNEAKGRRILETRLLIHQNSGWQALTYIWNDEQTEAYLDVAGEEKTVTWKDEQGKKRSVLYAVPNQNQCKGCHNTNEKLVPIGPTARQLNGDYAYMSGAQNQLIYWKNQKILDYLPKNLSEIPRVPTWDKPNEGTIEQRARAYLDINCAHCHKENGPASTSGMFLDIHQTDFSKLGIYKTPVAAGRGSGNRKFGITPGNPDTSILVYRMESTDPGVMMPELSRKLIHQEGITLIRTWIKSLQIKDFEK